MNSLTVKRIFMTFVGIFLAGVSVAIFKASDFGTDPNSCFVMGVWNKVQLCLYHHQCVDAAGSIFSGPAFYRAGNCAESVFYGDHRGKRNAAF